MNVEKFESTKILLAEFDLLMYNARISRNNSNSRFSFNCDCIRERTTIEENRKILEFTKHLSAKNELQLNHELRDLSS